MTTIQRISISLLITIVLITGFSFFAYSGFFEYIETTFYNKRVTELYENDLQKKKNIIEQYHKNYRNRFEAVLEEIDVGKIFSPNWDREYIFKHENLFDTLLSEYQGLLLVRFIDENNKIHYSTSDDDVERRSDFRIVYRILDDSMTKIPIQDLQVTQEEMYEILLDYESDRIVYKFPLIDELDQFRGTALFYLDKGTLEEYLVAQGGLQVGREVSLIPGGYLFFSRLLSEDILGKRTEQRWSENLFEEKYILTDEATGERFVLLSKSMEDLGTVGLLINQRLFQISGPLKIVLLIASGLTLFLILLLVFSLRQDRELIIRNRLKKFQLQFLQGYLENQDKLDWNQIKGDIKRKQSSLRKELKKGLGKLKPDKEKKIDSLIDEGWHEIFEILDKRSIQQPASAVNIDNLEEVIQRIYALQQTLPQKTNPEGTSPDLQANSAQPVRENAEGITETQEAVNSEELQSAGAIEELEELEEVELAEEIEPAELAEAVEEVEEVEAAEVVEELEEIEEAGEVEELADAGEIEAAGESETAGELQVREEQAIEIKNAGSKETLEGAQERGEGAEIGNVEKALAEEAAGLSETTISPAYKDELEEVEELEVLEEVEEELEEQKEKPSEAGDGISAAPEEMVMQPTNYINFDMEEWGGFDENQKQIAIEDIHGVGIQSEAMMPRLHIVSEERESEIEELEVVSEEEYALQSNQSKVIGSRYTLNTLQHDIIHSRPVQGYLEVVDQDDTIDEVEELSEEPSEETSRMEEQQTSKSKQKQSKKSGEKKKRKKSGKEIEKTETAEELEVLESAIEEEQKIEKPVKEKVPVEDIEDISGMEELEEIEELEELEELEESEEVVELEEIEELEEVITDGMATETEEEQRPDAEEVEEGVYIFSLSELFNEAEGGMKESIVYENGIYQVNEGTFLGRPEKPNGDLKELVTSVLQEDQLEKPEDFGKQDDISIEEIIGFGDVELPFEVDDDKGRTDYKSSLLLQGQYSMFTSTGFQYDAFLNRYRSGKIGILKSLMKISQRTGALYAAILSQRNDKWFMYDSVGFEHDRAMNTIFSSHDEIYTNYLQKRQPIMLDISKTSDELKKLISENDMEYIKSLLFLPAIFQEKEAFLFLGMKKVPLEINSIIRALAEI